MPKISCGCGDVETHIVKCYWPRLSANGSFAVEEALTTWEEAGRKTSGLEVVLVSRLKIPEDQALKITKNIAQMRYSWNHKRNGNGDHIAALNAAGKDEINDALRIFSEYEKVCREIIETENKLDRLKEEKERYTPAIRALQLVKESVRSVKSATTKA